MRASGILMHISSLSSEYGIGTLGKDAYKFADFLHEAKQSYWQILPVCPTSYGDSPYQSFASRAGNPYFIDLDMLCEDGLLKKSEYSEITWEYEKNKVDYSNMYDKRFSVLKKAFERFKGTDMSEFNRFLDENENWISNYGLFMSVKSANGGKPWFEWENGLKTRDPHSLWLWKSAHEDEVMFWEFLQFKFFGQWHKLKEYVNSLGIKIIGDIPIYTALDSMDVWVSPDLFDLDDALMPRTVAGCPPDGFSKTGQLWGNPIYNWEQHKNTGYGWWINRLGASFDCFDIVRIDHFRGFDEYYAIPFGDKTAEHGSWLKGPGIEFFDFMKQHFGTLPIIAEDLGFLTPSVIEMLKKSGFPGMKVLEFAFNPDEPSSYLPYNYDKNCVVYAGTHDNDTLIGWKNSSDKREIQFCKKYFDISDNDDFVWSFIKQTFACVGDTVIIQMQDYLGLDSDARMNTPSTASGNWRWRAPKRAFTKRLAEKIADITDTYGRAPK